MESLKAVVREVAVQLVVSRDYSLPLCMRLRYEPTDPYVVRAAFFIHGDETVEWVLGRDLLSDGLNASAGEGDVRIWSAVGRGDEAMYIILGSSGGTALLEVPVRDIKSFPGRGAGGTDGVPAPHVRGNGPVGGGLAALDSAQRR